MNILLASSEIHPYSKTGGLADMVGALGKALARAGHRVGLVTPLYAGIRERFPGLARVDLPLDFPLGALAVRGEVWSIQPTSGLTVYFIDQPGFYQRPALYGNGSADYPDNAERFVFFSKAVAHLALNLPWKPEVMHVQDWPTGLVPLFIAHQGKQTGPGRPIRTCMTVHNLAYQGLFPASKYPLTNLPWDYFTPSGVEFYGQMGCLKAGIAYADVITTVSPRYAHEITTEEFGCGLDGLLRQRQKSLFGVLNGVDYEEWRTISNPFLKYSYAADDLAGKALNKLELQKSLGLPANDRIPLFGNIGRLVQQKGVDIMFDALTEALSAGFQFVLLGKGAPAFERAYQDLALRFPSQVAVRIGFDEGLSHQIEAGCDFFVMPSRFEPCGLNQMYGLRYGTIPVVRATGGLDDTVVDIREDRDRANGIKFHECSSEALTTGIRKALALYEEPALLHEFRVNAMKVDFSWDRIVGQYLSVYNGAVRH